MAKHLRTRKAFLKEAARIHKERVVFEKYVSSLDNNDYSLLLKGEKTLGVHRGDEIGEGALTYFDTKANSNELKYWDNNVQHMWQGWQLSEQSSLPLEHLFPEIKVDRMDFEIGTTWGDPYVHAHRYKRGDYVSADEALDLINSLLDKKIPAASILQLLIRNLK